ncbi:MAG: winged helix-turn-helix transcriptional regulator [Candidatus Heimdallarchaeota archaeon]|nr:winged helix-turn-helix transcriptional regulator [Candidatus Heimdallarchaeota archaeon]
MLMSASATVGAYMISATAHYIIESKSDEPLSDRIIELPLPKVSVNEVKGDKLKILALLDQRGPTQKITSHISGEFGVSPQKASYHVNDLERMGLISVTSSGREKRATITPEGRILLKLHV